MTIPKVKPEAWSRWPTWFNGLAFIWTASVLCLVFPSIVSGDIGQTVLGLAPTIAGLLVLNWIAKVIARHPEPDKPDLHLENPEFTRSNFQLTPETKTPFTQLFRLFTPPVETDWPALERELFNRRLLFDRSKANLTQWGNTDALTQELLLQANTDTEPQQQTKQKSTDAVMHENQREVLAATDLFVEKAQSHLTKRAIYYYRTGYVFIAILIIWLAITANILSSLDPKGYFDALLTTPTWQAFLVWMMRSATVAGILLAGIYFIVSLIRAFFHEATVLLHRRHALRFGRLFIYLKLTKDQEDQINKRIDEMKTTDLEEVFGWNIQPTSAFKDIDPAKMSTSLQKHLLDTISKIVHIEMNPVKEDNVQTQLRNPQANPGNPANQTPRSTRIWTG